MLLGNTISEQSPWSSDTYNLSTLSSRMFPDYTILHKAFKDLQTLYSWTVIKPIPMYIEGQLCFLLDILFYQLLKSSHHVCLKRNRIFERPSKLAAILIKNVLSQNGGNAEAYSSWMGSIPGQLLFIHGSIQCSLCYEFSWGFRQNPTAIHSPCSQGHHDLLYSA